jgi:hypothetical protein
MRNRLPQNRGRWWFLLVALLLPALACNAFAGRPDTALPPPPTLTPTPEGENEGVLPTLAPTVTLPPDNSVIPVQGLVRILVDLNVRSGPGVQFDRVGFLLGNEVVPVIGRDEISGWWQIPCPPTAGSDRCWISGGSQFTRLEQLETLPPNITGTPEP